MQMNPPSYGGPLNLFFIILFCSCDTFLFVTFLLSTLLPLTSFVPWQLSASVVLTSEVQFYCHFTAKCNLILRPVL